MLKKYDKLFIYPKEAVCNIIASCVSGQGNRTSLVRLSVCVGSLDLHCEPLQQYRNIPNRSPGGLDKRLGGGYIRLRELGIALPNVKYKMNLPSKLGGASIRGGACNRYIIKRALHCELMSCTVHHQSVLYTGGARHMEEGVHISKLVNGDLTWEN